MLREHAEKATQLPNTSSSFGNWCRHRPDAPPPLDQWQRAPRWRGHAGHPAPSCWLAAPAPSTGWMTARHKEDGKKAMSTITKSCNLRELILHLGEVRCLWQNPQNDEQNRPRLKALQKYSEHSVHGNPTYLLNIVVGTGTCLKEVHSVGLSKLRDQQQSGQWA